MGQNIRETGRKRARVAAVAVGATSVLSAAAIAAAVYAPSVVQTSSTTGNSSTNSGSSSDSDGSSRSERQQFPFGQGLQSSSGGGVVGHSSGS